MRRFLVRLAPLAALASFLVAASARAGCDATGTEQFNILVPEYITGDGNDSIEIHVHNPASSGGNMAVAWVIAQGNSSAASSCAVRFPRGTTQLCTENPVVPAGETLRLVLPGTSFTAFNIGSVQITVVPPGGAVAVNALVEVREFLNNNGSAPVLRYQVEAQACH